MIHPKRDTKFRNEKECLVKSLINEAIFMIRCHKYEAAITTINKVMFNLEDYNMRDSIVPPSYASPDDPPLILSELAQALLATRGEACLKQGFLIRALDDVERVIYSNPAHSKALMVKANVLFLQCNFEHSLVFFERGLKVCSESDRESFCIGRQRAIESISHALSSASIFNGLEQIEALLCPEKTSKILWGSVHGLVKSGAFSKKKPKDNLHSELKKDFGTDDVSNAMDKLPGFSQNRLPKQKQCKKKLKGGPPKNIKESVNKPKYVKGQAIGINKRAHLKHEETYFKTLLSDPRVSCGEYRVYLNIAISDAIEYIEAREHFWSQQ